MKKRSLSFFVFFNVISVGIIALMVTASLWISSIYDRYESDYERIEAYHISKVKDELKNRVDTIISFIDYRSHETESRLKSEIENRVFELNNLINHLYDSNINTLTEAEIKTLIIDTVRGLRYNDGRGYYFIDSLEGDVVLYPIAPESEGKNLFNLQDKRGNYALQDEINLVKRQEKGFIVGYWTMPGDENKEYKKITYVHEFKPFNWYFGTGEYVDIVEQQIQNEIKKYINQLTYGEQQQQYIFIHDQQGTELANGLFPDLIDKNHIDLTDINGAYVFREQIAIVNQPPYYGYLTHYWPSTDPNKSAQQREKLTYVAAIKEWGWVIGSGADMMALNQAIDLNKTELHQRVMSSIINVVLLMIGILLLSATFANIVAKHINNSIRIFTRSLESSSENLLSIDNTNIEYREFQHLADVSNKTTNRINNLLHNDELTNIFNRRYINKLLDSLMMDKREDDTISILLIDIDEFKAVNDQYGHPVGDRVLIEVANCIQRQIAENHYVARYGGEEFLVVMPNTCQALALEIANRIRVAVAALEIEELGHAITLSGGISTSLHQQTVEMIKEADFNLYQAKNSGKNRIIVSSQPENRNQRK
jgi:diguanylate cyclase (GGDEF)-like protein